MHDAALAASLQLRLKPAFGPAPQLNKIHAALLMLRDHTLDSREACRRVEPKVPQGSHMRVALLRDPIAALLTPEQLTQANPPPTPPLPSQGTDAASNSCMQSHDVVAEADELGLPALAPVPGEFALQDVEQPPLQHEHECYVPLPPPN